MSDSFNNILTNIFIFTFLFGLVFATIYAYFYIQGRRRRRNLERAEQTICLQISFPTPERKSGYLDPKGNAEQTKRFLSKWHAKLLQKGLKAYLEGQSYLALEISATGQSDGLGFFVELPRSELSYFSKLLQQEFPNASWEELGELPLSKVNAALEINLSQNELLPFKTYLEQEQDFLTVLQQLSDKLQENEGWSVQLTLQVLNSDHWQHLSVEQARKLNGNDLQAAERGRALEKKAKEPGFRTSLRILGTAPDHFRAEALLQELVGLFSVFDDQIGNQLRGQYRESDSREICNSYLQHKLPTHLQIWNVSEIASIFHLPVQSLAGDRIKWQRYRNLELSASAATSGLLLGQNLFGKNSTPVYLAESDRSAGTLVLGKDGSGKSNLIYNLIMQDLATGKGLVLLDKTGGLTERILRNFPTSRTADLLLFDFQYADRPYGLNFLITPKSSEQAAVLQFFSEFCQSLCPASVWNKSLQDSLQKVLLTLWQDPELDCNLNQVLNFCLDQKSFDYQLSICQDQALSAFWQEHLTDSVRLELQNFCQNYLLPLLQKPVLKMALANNLSYWDLAEVQSKQILIFRLIDPALDELQSRILSQILLFKFHNLGIKNYYLDDAEQLERTALLNFLQVAKQNDSQVTISMNSLQNTTPALKQALLQLANRLLLRLAETDSKDVARAELSADDLQNLALYKAYACLQVAGQQLLPASLNLDYQTKSGSQDLARALTILSSLKYARDRKFNTN